MVFYKVDSSRKKNQIFSQKTTLSNLVLIYFYSLVRLSSLCLDVCENSMQFRGNCLNAWECLYLFMKIMKITESNHHFGTPYINWGGSKQFPSLIFRWIIITTLKKHLILQSRYSKTTQSLVNMLLSFLYQKGYYTIHDSLKTLLIGTLRAYNSITARWKSILSFIIIWLQ